MKAVIPLVFLVVVVAGYEGRHSTNELFKRHYGYDRSKRIFECRQLEQSCSGLPKCCGEWQCYWENGYSMIREGVCVECVEQGKKCQRDKQCCGGLQCDKVGFLHVDGNCQPPRAAGEICYSNEQCEGSCSKKWYQTKGRCQ